MTEEKRKLTKEERQEKALKQHKEREKNKAPQDTEKFYCTNKALMAEMIKWRDSAEKVEDRVISEDLGKMILHIATKLTNHSKFHNYNYDLKQEMISYACFKCVQGLKNYNFAFNNVFSYITTACWNAFVNILAKHYKQINLKKEIMKTQLAQLECADGINSSKIINSFIKDYLGLTDAEM